MLTAADQKKQSHKKVILHDMNVNVMLSNITFLTIFAVFDL